MAEITYLLCAATALWAAVLLLLRYRATPTRLLFWSAVAFCGLAIQNVLVAVDLLIVPHIDLLPIRAGVAAVAMLVFVGGIISETA